MTVGKAMRINGLYKKNNTMREAHKPNLNTQIYVHLLRNKKAVWRSRSVVMD